MCEGMADTCGLCADVSIVRQLCRRGLDLLGILTGLCASLTSVLRGSLQIALRCLAQGAWQEMPFLDSWAG